ncbi:hypothetical protein ACK24S_000186 [Vibrio fluvialis]
MNNCFLEALDRVSSNRKEIGSFPPTTFYQDKTQSWDDFLEEYNAAEASFVNFCTERSTLTVQKSEEEGSIFICIECGN